MNDSIIRNMIRTGKVSSVNENNGTVRVIFDDKDNIVSDEIPMFDYEYDMPDINDQVVCLFLPNGIQQGFCLKGFYSAINPPPVKNKDIYFKRLDNNTSIQYNKKTKQLTINSINPIIVNSDIKVNGNISATGTIGGTT